jgi:hypothetical protein
MKSFVFVLLLCCNFALIQCQDLDSTLLSYQTEPDASARAVPSRDAGNRVTSGPLPPVSSVDQTLALYPNALDASWYSGSLLRMNYLLSQLRSPILPYAYLTGVQLQRWLLAQLVQLTREQLMPRMTQFSAGLLSRNCELLSNQVLEHFKSLLQTLQTLQPQSPQHRSPDN